jgi:hypothetical protein
VSYRRNRCDENQKGQAFGGVQVDKPRPGNDGGPWGEATRGALAVGPVGNAQPGACDLEADAASGISVTCSEQL